MDWFALALLSGLVALDATTFPQIMISRPLVAGTVAGWLGGAPEVGLAVGAILEIFGLVVLPFGAARYPESGLAAVAAAGGAVAVAGTQAAAPAVLMVVVTVALLWEQVAGYTVLALRRLDERLVAEGGQAVSDPDGLQRRHLGAMTLDFGRGVVLGVVGAVLCVLALRLILPVWGLGASTTGEVLHLAAVAMLAAALDIFGGFADHRRWFLGGVSLGVLILVVA